MTTIALPVAGSSKVGDLVGFFHLPKGQDLIDLSSSNLINVLHEYERYNQTFHPGYDNKCVRNKLYELEQYVQANVMPWRVDTDFYLMFYTYCTELSTSPMLPSSVENYCNLIRSALKWGMRHRVEVSDSFDQFEIPSFVRQKIALRPDEISLIYHFDIDSIKVPCKIKKVETIIHKERYFKYKDARVKIKDSDERGGWHWEMRPRRRWYNRTRKETIVIYVDGFRPLEKSRIATFKKVRDMFVLMTQLGQRYSDAKRITPEWFSNGGTTMGVRQQKTDGDAVVDIRKLSTHPEVAFELLKKYNYTAPYKATVGNFNFELHELLEFMFNEFDRKYIHREYKLNNEMIIEDVPIYKMVTSHTARRTFITNAVLRDVRENDIRRASGHKDIQSFIKYIICEDN